MMMMKTVTTMMMKSALLAAVAAITCGAVSAQTLSGGKEYQSQIPAFKDLQRWDPNYRAQRTPDGKPDLQGVWSDASQTQMSRGSGMGGAIKVDTLVIPDEKIQQLLSDNYYTKQYKIQGKQSDLKDNLLGDKDANRGYNAFWIDPGAEYGRVNGEWRSSWITTPTNGQMPMTPEGRKARGDRVGLSKSVKNTGPEVRTIGDRCLISYAGQAGPPMVNGMYNNHHQIVQTPTHIMINTEMNHDSRIIRIGADPKPNAIKQWFGDSLGHWEGETLVVVTRNLHPIQARGGSVPLSEKGVVTERFTRKSPVEVFYEYTVDDPVYYTQVWKGEMPLRLSTEHIYEYACHEGNYALPGILRGDAMGVDTAIEKEGE